MAKSTLKFYDCVLTIGGSEPVLQQVVKQNVSERELRVMRYLHGPESISKMEPTKVDDHERSIDDTAHYFEMAEKFDNDHQMIEKVFGVTLDGFYEWFEEKQYQADAERQERARLRTEQASKPPVPSVPENQTTTTEEIE